MRKAVWCSAGIAIFALGIFAASPQAVAQSPANVSGTWTLTIAPAPPAILPGAPAQPAAEQQGPPPGGRGGTPPALTLKQDGNTITGTFAGGRGPGLAVIGTVYENTVAWTIYRRLADGIARPEVYKGTIEGDTITGSVAEPTVDPTQQYSVSFTAKRGANR